MNAQDFWQRKRVYITGHTGFKGSWLSIWLLELGARVAGYALPTATQPSLFVLSGLSGELRHTIGDVRDQAALIQDMQDFEPDIVFHLAAQSLVRESYRQPVETFAANVMGTVHLLEAVRACPTVQAVVNVTTDKCYENKEWQQGYCETDALGGFDPYSASKACSELVTQSYRRSFFGQEQQSAAIATARAGNVIGGGDWALERLVPDCIRAIEMEEPIILRNPQATRPWQHVLEPLSGYLRLAEYLYTEGQAYAEAWNFGPSADDERTVDWVVEKLSRFLGERNKVHIIPDPRMHEAGRLALDCSKAMSRLGWRAVWDAQTAVAMTAQWVQDYWQGKSVREICRQQIVAYNQAMNNMGMG